ncbi:MAG TPA: T9SS type A sorting domain-containing protein, partial [Candidatus Handelsmanbacteria bacterium]|nr:T9SS type A sorting domain-containing protein [Candidatus Handelsmanbacteria bacterium]
AITISGLDPASTYDYRIIVEATNGQTASFEPNLPASKSARAGKRLKILQPPGGAGSFTTNTDPDTQYPVILSGPTISSKTHDTAIVEWLTDEPANSDVQFGAESVSEGRTNSGVSQTSHKMVLSNLEPGSPYLFQVASTDAAGNGATTSAEGVFSTNPEVDLTAPEITEEPAVIYQNDEVATIQWTTDEDATAQIDFGTAADSLLFIRTSSSTGDNHEITLTNLTPATEYFYQVTSSDLSNNGPTVTDVLSFTTDPEPDATPPVLSDVVVTAAHFSAIVTWLTDELADSFVDLGTVSGLLDVTVGDASDVLEHDVVLTNLQPDTEYFLTAGSGDRAGNGPTESVEVSFTTLAAPDTIAPGAPTGLTGTAGNESVALSWETNSEADLGGYNLYRRLSGDGSFVAIATLLPTPGYTDLGLDNGSSYEYQITAIDRASPGNESDPGLDLSLSPTLSAAPTAPSDLSVDGEALQPTFSFTNAEPFSSGATLTYTIQVSTQSDFSDVTASESGITSGSAATSWTITRSLDDGATYYWRARAVEGDLTGPFTVTEEFTASTGPLLSGDFNDSGAVDFDDFFAFVDAFGGSADDFPDFDLNDSGSGTFIDFDDFFRFVDAFGTTASKTAQTVASTHPVDESAQIRLIADAGLDGTSSLPRDVVQLLVQADALNDVDAYGLTLTWDPAALSFTDAQAGPTAPDNNWFRILEQRPGRILLGNARSDGGLMETGVLAQLTFRLRDRQLANGTRIELEQLLLASTSGVRLAPAIPSASLRPSGFALGQAYPNPFNPSTQIDFALAAETSTRLVIYDVLGRVVRTLVPGQSMPAGFYSVSWDGRDAAGRAVGNGLYFYRLATLDFVGTGRMMMLK